MNNCIFRGSNSAIFISDSLLIGGQLLEERVCFYKGGIFLLRYIIILEGLLYREKQMGGGFFVERKIQEVTQVVPLYKMAKKIMEVHYD